MKGKTISNGLKILLCALPVLIFLCLWFFLMPYRVGDQAEVSTVTWTAPIEEEIQPEGTDKTSQYLILVNKTHSIHDDYIPNDLVRLTSKATKEPKKNYRLRKIAAEAFERLVIQAREAGHSILAIAAFQLEARDDEFQTGLAVDVSAAAVKYRTVQKLGATAEGKWLAEHAYKYGFIIRHPKGKKDITGYAYEPWHLRYVGRDAAWEMRQQQLTLEEYLGVK